MGRATRWFKGLFGLKTASKDRQRPAAGIGGSGRESYFCHNPATIPPNITLAEASWLTSYYPDSKDDDEAARNKHAIAVVAATAAAADAAVAAAQAAAQVVRLTAQGRSLSKSGNNLLGGSCRRHNRAAVRIQSNFRAHLARKALRALKGLVKIQALVRGYLVRRQAAATLRGMQALIRAQANVRSKRAFLNITPSSTTRSESLSASWSTLEQDAPKAVEVDSGHNRPSPNTSFTAQFAPVRARHHCHHFDSGSTTAQTTPRQFPNPCPVTPTKGRAGEGNIHGGWETQRLYYEYPSYMAKTASFKAKVRSQSAPKQRSEGHKKRMPLTEGRSSVGTRRTSSSHVDHEVANFRDAVMCSLLNSHF